MITPYLTFQGNCYDVIKYYEKVFGTSVNTLLHYEDYVPENIMVKPDNLNEWIMHATMNIQGTNFWFADEITDNESNNNIIKLVVTTNTYAEAKEIYDNLIKEGIVVLAPTETFYSSFHASLIDKFKVAWNIVTLEK